MITLKSVDHIEPVVWVLAPKAWAVTIPGGQNVIKEGIGRALPHHLPGHVQFHL